MSRFYQCYVVIWADVRGLLSKERSLIFMFNEKDLLHVKTGSEQKNDTPLKFTLGKTPRNQLELPLLYFVVVDQWIDVIGIQGFIGWLKFYSWANREDKSNNERWNEAIIPISLSKAMKKLGVSKSTFYNSIIRPLWNVGLIDIVEYEGSENKGEKPKNIIVYKYPQNRIELASQPLEVVRDYDKDYHSKSRTFAKMGGRPKKVEKAEHTNKNSNESIESKDNTENESSNECQTKLELILEKINQNICPVNDYIKENVEKWLDILPSEVINAEIDNCIVYGAKTWAYIESALEEDHKQGIKTVKQLKEKIEKHKAKKKNSIKNNDRNIIRKEKEPEWFKERKHHEDKTPEYTEEEFLIEKAKLEKRLEKYKHKPIRQEPIPEKPENI